MRFVATIRTGSFLTAVTLSFATSAVLVGCSKQEIKGKDERPTSKVSGSVTLDGEIPSPGVKLVCESIDDKAKAGDRIPTATTDENGKFEFTTFKFQDGVPDGNYVVTITQPEIKLTLGPKAATGKPGLPKGPADLLKGRYANASEKKFELVVKGKPVDMGKLELTTK